MLDAKSKLAVVVAQEIIRVPLSGGSGEGLFALVDAADYHLVSGFKWRLHSGGYAQRTASIAERRDGLPKHIMMHRVILARVGRMADGLVSDHIDRDRLNNCRSNLRVVECRINSQNQGKPRVERATTAPRSRFKGVSWDRVARKWVAQAIFGGQARRLGCFVNEVDAARAYDAVALMEWGPDATTNVVLGLLPPNAGPEFVLRPPHVKSSPYRGVSCDNRDKVWRANIQVNGRAKALGTFRSEVDAARAYDAAAVRLHGDRAKTNVMLGLLPADAPILAPLYAQSEVW